MPVVTTMRLSNEPIVIVTFSGSGTELIDAELHRVELHSILDTVSAPVFFIINISDAQLNFDEILRGTSGAFRGNNAIFKHPNIRQILRVCDNPMLELVAEGRESEIFGNVKIQLFKTLEKALAYARATR